LFLSRPHLFLPTCLYVLEFCDVDENGYVTLNEVREVVHKLARGTDLTSEDV